MAISKNQPMRPAEIEILERVADIESGLSKEFLSKFEWGSQDEIEVIANNNTVITVMFADEKAEAPIVLITLQNNNGENALNAYAALRDVSTTEFHVRIYNLDETNNQQLKVNWLAIGE